MIYRILRYVIAILVGTAAYVGMDSLAPIIDPYLVSQFESFGDMSLTIARISVLIFGTLLGVIIGYLISSFILKQGLVIAKRLERILTHIPNQELIAGSIGLLFLKASINKSRIMIVLSRLEALNLFKRQCSWYFLN